MAEVRPLMSVGVDLSGHHGCQLLLVETGDRSPSQRGLDKHPGSHLVSVRLHEIVLWPVKVPVRVDVRQARVVSVEAEFVVEFAPRVDGAVEAGGGQVAALAAARAAECVEGVACLKEK